jgi:hypothetical protein
MAVTTKKLPKATKAAPAHDPSQLQLDERFLRDGDMEKFKEAKTANQKREIYDALTARAMAMPEVRAASVMQKFEGPGLCIMSSIDELSVQVAKVKGGDMSRPEAILLSQAHALDALFANLLRRAHGNMEAGYLQATETYMRLALRAQNQSRTTLETLSTIKNPPVVFTKQMNVSHGPQQVNNGVASNAEPMVKDITHTIKSKNEQIKLGGSSHELRPNTRTQETIGRTVPGAEAVGEIYRTED